MKAVRKVLLLALVVVLAASVASFAQLRSYRPITDDMLVNAHNDPENWIMWRRTYDLWGYSPLDQINKDNVHKLQLAWGVVMNPGLQEAAPLVYDGIMFLHHQGNRVQALDATTGDVIWEYFRVLPEVTGAYHTNQYRRTKNSIALYKDKVYLATSDAYVVALDARTGQVVWETEVDDWSKGYSYTIGPVVAKGIVVTGMSGCSMTDTPGGCYVVAHDAETGEELWRTYTIAQPGEFGDDTWGGLPIESRWGASLWGTPSYDPELDLLFIGTAMPIPYPEVVRGSGDGTLLYTNSTLALHLHTGEIVWYYQHLPRDNWDLDHPFERVLVDAVVDGRERKLVLGAFGKTGIVWFLDRETGEFVRAVETIYQNVQSVDPVTGEVTVNVDLVFDQMGETKFVCPHLSGGKLFNSGAYNPITHAYYVPLNNTCMEATPREVEFKPGESVAGLATRMVHAPDSGGLVGRVDAINVSTGQHIWSHQQRAPWGGSLITTASGLVFGGDANRRFKAFDAETGKVLWELPLTAPVTGWPITYAVDGRQYLAVPVGGGTMTNFLQLTPEIPNTSGSNILLVFALPEE